MSDQTKKSATTTSQEIQTPPSSSSSSQNGVFFPWLEDDEHKKLSGKVLRRFPVLGAVGLLGSALTVLLSWMTLFFFSGHKVIDGGHLPKPAAWLSIILSLNGILVHMAVSQGIAVTWWYRASRQQTTVAELHNVWAAGSSIVSVLTCWRSFNYVALATVFVATLPANGILLQNAVSSGINYKNITKSTTFGIATSLPAGFSADLNSDGSVGTYKTLWQTAMMPLVIANVDGVYKSYGQFNTCNGTCSVDLKHVGFNATCVDSTLPYDLPLNNHHSTTTADSTILSVDISWNASYSNQIGLNTLFKSDSSCTGSYQVRNCTLDMATVINPVRRIQHRQRRSLVLVPSNRNLRRAPLFHLLPLTSILPPPLLRQQHNHRLRRHRLSPKILLRLHHHPPPHPQLHIPLHKRRLGAANPTRIKRLERRRESRRLSEYV